MVHALLPPLCGALLANGSGWAGFVPPCAEDHCWAQSCAPRCECVLLDSCGPLLALAGGCGCL
eukprot:1844870-Amphidinium_carterae.1